MPVIHNRVNKKFRVQLAVIILLFAVIGAFGYKFIKINGSTIDSVTTYAAGTCTVDSKLVNSCRPWLGAFSDQYPDKISWKDEITGHEARIGRKLDIVHNYHANGEALTADEKAYIARKDSNNQYDTILLLAWRPTQKTSTVIPKFTDVTSGKEDTKINNLINSLLEVKAQHPTRKIILTPYIEPEPTITSGASGCTTYGSSATAGTPAEFRAAWQYMHNKFSAAGANNVLWGINFMGFDNWNCMIDDLWPGNNYVDWIFWDPYGTPSIPSFESKVGNLYDYLTANSSANYDYNSKAWGLAEFGIGGTSTGPTQSQVINFYNEAKQIIETNTRFPRLKAYVVFDQRGVHDTQVSYYPQTDSQGYYLDSLGNRTSVQSNRVYVYDSSEEASYKALANTISTNNNGTSSTLIGDIKLPLDGKVDISDLSLLITKWNTSEPAADINSDGTVNIYDLSLLISNWTG